MLLICVSGPAAAPPGRGSLALEVTRLHRPEVEPALATRTVRREVQHLAVTAEGRRAVARRRLGAVQLGERLRLGPRAAGAGPRGAEQARAVALQRALQVHGQAVRRQRRVAV